MRQLMHHDDWTTNWGQSHLFYLENEFDINKLKLPKDNKEAMDNIFWLGVGIRSMDDPFFEEGDKVCGVYRRMGIVDEEDDEDLCHEVMKRFTCSIPNCEMEFDNLLKYDLHYNSCHRYTCSQCKKQLPSPHLLDLHVSEMHDSFFQILSERKPMFRCFVEDCLIFSSSPKERKDHCIEVHKFPHDFKFDSSRKSPKKKMNKSKKIESQPPIVKEQANNTEVHCSTSFTFGHRKTGKTFKTLKERKEKPIEMHELMETLPSFTNCTE